MPPKSLQSESEPRKVICFSFFVHFSETAQPILLCGAKESRKNTGHCKPNTASKIAIPIFEIVNVDSNESRTWYDLGIGLIRTNKRPKQLNKQTKIYENTVRVFFFFVFFFFSWFHRNTKHSKGKKQIYISTFFVHTHTHTPNHILFAVFMADGLVGAFVLAVLWVIWCSEIFISYRLPFVVQQ